jgi:hypothetical protein
MKERRPNHAISSLDQLPEDAKGILIWAVKELEKGNRTDTDVLFEFNDQLAVIGYGPISKSAFGRYALKKRIVFADNAEFTNFTAVFAEHTTAQSMDERTAVLVQLLFTAIYKQITRKELSAKEVLDYGRAIAALNSAKRTSAGEKTKDEDYIANEMAQFFEKAKLVVKKSYKSPDEGVAYLDRIHSDLLEVFKNPVDAVETATQKIEIVVKVKGISAEASEEIKAQLLGVAAPIIEGTLNADQPEPAK